MQEGAHQNDAAPMNLEDPCITEEKGKLIKWEGIYSETLFVCVSFVPGLLILISLKLETLNLPCS